MKKIKIFSAIIISFFISNQSNAQVGSFNALTDFLNQMTIIPTAVPFLTITPDSRSAGMGQTGVATSPDANSIHWNPAKLAFAEKKMAVAISYAPWMRAFVPDINLGYVSLYSKLDSNSTIGISARYFSMGNITFTSAGSTIGQFRPNEYAIDGCYSRRLGKYFSVGATARIIRSNLTNGITVGGQDSKTNTGVAVDLGGYYHNNEIAILGKKSVMMLGIAITNMGSKMTYPTSVNRQFLPTNLRIGQGIQINLGELHQVSLQYEFNKLLVPSPPVYVIGANGSPVIGPNGAPLILSGKNPNAGVPQGMLQSFFDSPDGFKGELQETTLGTGIEYWYDHIFAIRAGYFHESKYKGNQQFLTLGAGVKYNVFGLDFAYFIPTNGQRSPFQNTLRFTLLFDFDQAIPQHRYNKDPGDYNFPKSKT